ncbi:MAG: hypothetical protein IJC48_01670 [Clostridia bacterium]|nr:hypothetical protein [Clostridia bacterium]
MANKIKRQAKQLKRYTNRRLIWRNVRFYFFYLVLLGLIGFVFFFIYTYLEDTLSRYESVQPKYVAEEFGKIFIEQDYKKLYTYEDHSELSLEDEEDYVNYISSLTEGTYIDYKEVPSKDPNVKKYSVTSNGRSFASFTIEKTGEKVNCGFLGDVEVYAPGDITTDVIQPITYTVTVPEGSSLFVNGNPVSVDHIVSSGEKTFADGHLPEQLNVPTSLCTYRFTTALGVPEIKAADANGQPVALTDKGNNTFAFSYNYQDEAMRAEHEAHIVDFAQKFCMLTTKNALINNVRAFTKPDSNAEEYILGLDRTWLNKAESYSFANIETCNYVAFSDSIFSCEVRLDYTSITKGKENTYHWASLLFLEKNGDKWLIYDIDFLVE